MMIYDNKTPWGRELLPKPPDDLNGECVTRYLTPDERIRYGLYNEISKGSQNEKT